MRLYNSQHVRQKRSLRFLRCPLIFCCLFGLTTFASAQTPTVSEKNEQHAKPTTQQSLLTLVGDNVGICIELNQLKQQFAQIKQSEMYRRLQATTVFRDWLKTTEFQIFDKSVEQLEQQGKQKIVPLIANVFGQSTVLATYWPKKKQDVPVGVLITRAKNQAALKSGLQLWNRLAPNDVIAERKYRGQSYFQRNPAIQKTTSPQKKSAAQQPVPALFYVILDDIFAISDHEQAIQKVIALAQSQHKTEQHENKQQKTEVKSLFRSPIYREARRQLTGNPLITVFCNPLVFDPLPPNQPQPLSTLPQRFSSNNIARFLWKQCRSLMVGIRFDRGFVIESIVNFHHKKLPAQWANITRHIANATTEKTHIPNEALAAVTGRYLPQLLLKEIIHQLMKKKFRQASQQIGIGPQQLNRFNECLSYLEGNIALFVLPRKNSQHKGVLLDAAGTIEFSSTTATKRSTKKKQHAKIHTELMNALQTLTKMQPLLNPQQLQKAAVVKSQQQGKITAHWLDGLGAYRPAFAITPQHLLIASSPATLWRLEKLAKSTNQKIVPNQFAQTQRQFFPNCKQILFVNFQQLRQELRKIKPILQQHFSQSKTISSSKALKQFHRAIDLLGIIDNGFAAVQIKDTHIRVTIGGVTQQKQK